MSTQVMLSVFGFVLMYLGFSSLPSWPLNGLLGILIVRHLAFCVARASCASMFDHARLSTYADVEQDLS